MIQWQEIFGYGFSQRALLAAALIGFVNAYLGGYVVLKRSSLFAGGLTHTLFPGIALGALVAGLNPYSALFGAVFMALLAGLGATGIASVSRIDRDTALAILYTAAFGAGLIVLERIGTYVNIENYLFGNILGIGNTDLWFVYVAGGLTMTLLLLLQRPLLLYVFSPETAASQGIPVQALGHGLAALLVVNMVISLQAVGAVLTLGLLIAPSAILYLFSDSVRSILWGAGVLGAGVSVLCVMFSILTDMQTGPLIAGAFGVFFLLAFALSPVYGLAALFLKRFQMRGGA
jgi:manganese/iron transport system permease protein/iron/zinc/copper transport system permease protein